MAVHDTHDLEDVGYHGSGTWQCRFCKLYQSDPNMKLPCSKREECLKWEKINKDRQDWHDYQDMLRVKRRFEELADKFKDGPPEGV